MNRAMNMLGLCARAGKLVTGEKACVQQIRSGGAQLALLDGAAAENAVKALTQACQTHGVALARTAPDELGAAIGKAGRMAAVVTDAGMARRLRELLDAEG